MDKWKKEFKVKYKFNVLNKNMYSSSSFFICSMTRAYLRQDLLFISFTTIFDSGLLNNFAYKKYLPE